MNIGWHVNNFECCHGVSNCDCECCKIDCNGTVTGAIYLAYRGGNATRSTKAGILELGQLLRGGRVERFLARHEELLSCSLEEEELLVLADEIEFGGMRWPLSR